MSTIYTMKIYLSNIFKYWSNKTLTYLFALIFQKSFQQWNWLLQTIDMKNKYYFSSIKTTKTKYYDYGLYDYDVLIKNIVISK